MSPWVLPSLCPHVDVVLREPPWRLRSYSQDPPLSLAGPPESSRTQRRWQLLVVGSRLSPVLTSVSDSVDRACLTGSGLEVGGSWVPPGGCGGALRGLVGWGPLGRGHFQADRGDFQVMPEGRGGAGSAGVGHRLPLSRGSVLRGRLHAWGWQGLWRGPRVGVAGGSPRVGHLRATVVIVPNRRGGGLGSRSATATLTRGTQARSLHRPVPPFPHL